ncbi:unnamed protein product [Bursaphelenchus xylophilus]|uniref:(pine wood nematode) hypothetical protein n=1 Tax=Bursaphelenchus xylophilus TaxID=6326 RepID=A0A1I7SD39_BURXY|nr:unnamed protein product [Bursaphelenchus xylophilus]CAG9092986.1 unnamed protein product [Bursaphelenchus xylophilus]
MDTSYYVVLPSSTPNSFYENRSCDYTVLLPKTLKFDSNYVCGLQSIVYPHSWASLGTTTEEYITIHGENFKYTVFLPPGSHRNISALAELINDVIKQETESFKKVTDNRPKREAPESDDDAPEAKKPKIRDEELLKLYEKNVSALDQRLLKDKEAVIQARDAAVQAFSNGLQREFNEFKTDSSLKIRTFSEEKTKEEKNFEENINKQISDLQKEADSKHQQNINNFNKFKQDHEKEFNEALSKLQEKARTLKEAVPKDFDGKLAKEEATVKALENTKNEKEKVFNEAKKAVDTKKNDTHTKNDTNYNQELKKLQDASIQARIEFETATQNHDHALKHLNSLREQRPTLEGHEVTRINNQIEDEQNTLTHNASQNLEFRKSSFESQRGSINHELYGTLEELRVSLDNMKKQLRLEVSNFDKAERAEWERRDKEKQQQIEAKQKEEDENLKEKIAEITKNVTIARQNLMEEFLDRDRKHFLKKKEEKPTKAYNQGERIYNQIFQQGPQAMDEILQNFTPQPIKFSYNDASQRIKLEILHPKVQYITMTSQLCYTLGFPLSEKLKNNTIAKYPADLSGGIKQLMVYIPGLTSNVIVGNSNVPLLRVVTVQGQPGDIIEQIYESPIYVPVEVKETSMMHVKILTMEGREVPFAHGDVWITLHFKKCVIF